MHGGGLMNKYSRAAPSSVQGEETSLAAVLLEMTRHLRTLDDEGEVARVLAEALCKAALYDPTYGVSIYRHDRTGVLPEQLLGDGPLGRNVAVGMSIAARVVRDGGRFPLGTLDGAWGEASSYTTAGVPLRAGEVLVGVIVVYRAPRQPYTADEDTLLQIFASQGAAAIGHIRPRASTGTAPGARRNDVPVDQMHTAFVSTVSHELLTPLTSIIGFTETLQQYWGQLTDEQKMRSVEKISLSSRRLEHLVHDVLTISRLETREITMTSGPVLLSSVARTAIHGIEGRHAKRGEIAVESIPHAVTALADRDRLERVIVSLLENAVLYSSPLSPIVVRCYEDAAHAVLDVVDQGVGIAPDDMDRLFTRFGKIATVVHAGRVGMGLGLYIARGLVEAMNGTLTARSTLGQGSTFRVALPLFKQTAPPTPH